MRGEGSQRRQTLYAGAGGLGGREAQLQARACPFCACLAGGCRAPARSAPASAAASPLPTSGPPGLTGDQLLLESPLLPRVQVTHSQLDHTSCLSVVLLLQVSPSWFHLFPPLKYKLWSRRRWPFCVLLLPSLPEQGLCVVGTR